MAAALLLSRAGHRVMLFERVAEPKPVGAGLLLQPTGLREIDRLGLSAAIRDSGAPIERLFGTTASGHSVLDLRYEDAARYAGGAACGLGIHRGALAATLWSAVQAGHIALRLGQGVAALVQEPGGVVVHGEATASLGKFDVAVVADGTFSQLRGQLDIRQTLAVYPWGAWWAILPDRERRYSGVLRQTYRSASRMLGIMPIGRSPSAGDATPHVTLFWSVRRDEENASRARGLSAWKGEVGALSPDAAPLLAEVSDFAQLLLAVYADVRMARWHDRRIVVIGDAAHATSPQLGQGANLALIDAAVLARCLAAGRDVEQALADYTATRRAHLGYYQWASSALTPVFQSDGRMLPLLRDAALGIACRMPLVRGQMLATLTGTKAGFLWGSLQQDE
jgi:2-polyprenyl-6-methoxyphenol hydroxylase-like FAD-dependent oxidoreductase